MSRVWLPPRTRDSRSRGGLGPFVVHAKERDDVRHVPRGANRVGDHPRKPGRVRLGPAGGDQLVVDLARKRQVGFAGDVNVPQIPSPEPEYGGGGNLETAYPLSAGVRLFADAGPCEQFAFDLLQNVVLHRTS